MLKDVTKEIFLPEYSQLMKDKVYLELMEKYKTKEKTIRKEVFAMYTSPWFKENQEYNEKNATVEMLSVVLDVKEDIKQIKAPWIKYLEEVLDGLIEDYTKLIENKIGWLATWMTMSVYTDTDLMLRWADVYVNVYNFYEKSLEWFKTPKEEDNSNIEEDNS